MKTIKLACSIICLAGIASIMMVSCSKNLSTADTSSTSLTTTSTSATIAIAESSASDDSVYIIQPCGKGQYRHSIDEASLPSTVTSYLITNYTGYAFEKGFTIQDSTGTIHGYVVVIMYNDKPVGLLFDENGAFVRVLEQREPGDMHGPGWHDGGLFCNRDGKHKDTVALANLPTAITTYIAANYPGDTLLKAFKNADSSYLVLSKNNGVYATLFAADGSFIKRLELPAPGGKPQPIAQADLPAIVLTYLTNTYPSYVFDKAFSITFNDVVQGYVVIIDANNTRYAVQFDATGNFVAARAVW